MPTIQKKMEKEVAESYAGLAKFETPKKIALLEHEFTVDGGELTPSLKVRRKFVDTKYKATIDRLYEESAAP
jgi:long-chain acyl-CoA synthetase